jgi:hypothetical protein
MNDLTREWLEVFAESKRNGENLADSIFWRLSVQVCLPTGVDGGNPQVQQALAEIRESIARREREAPGETGG